MAQSKYKTALRHFCLRIYFLVRLYVHGFIEMLLQQYKPVKCDASIQEQCYKGRVALCTGGTAGIGLSVSKLLCRQGMTVVAAGPHPFSEQTITREIKEYIKRRQLLYIHLDLASFASIREAVQQFSSQFDSLDFLINNAGVMLVPYAHTEQGLEQHMGVNFVGHVVLTKLLLNKMKNAAISGSCPHIINVSSSVHKIAFIPHLLSGLFYCNPPVYSAHLAYALSKLAIVLYTECLADQLSMMGKPSILVNSVHPGVVSSSLYKHVFLPLRLIQEYVFAPLCFRTVDEGASTITNCLSNQDVTNVNGCYTEDGFYYSKLSSVLTSEKEKFWKDVGQMIHKASCTTKSN